MKILYYFILIVFISCKHYPADIQPVLSLAETNRSELEKVINYYKKKGDADKLKAAYFLIGNMTEKYSFSGEAVRNFDPIFDLLDSMHRNKIPVPIKSPVLKKSWDSLVDFNGFPMLRDADIVKDYSVITADYLIDNIEWSFRVKNQFPWCRNLSLDQFFELILPYRVGREDLEKWREHLYNRFKNFRDTTTAKNVFDYATLLNLEIRSYITTSQTMHSYPFDMTVNQMERARRGACRHVVFYEAMAMRANGIPVGVDYTPLWGDMNRGHEWNVLLMDNGKFFPFDAGAATFGGIFNYPYRFAKVFRMTYANQNAQLPSESEVPVRLLNKNQIDVTNEYTKAYNISIPLEINPKVKKNYAVICTFYKNTWTAQDWGIIADNKAHFKNMGSNILYIVMYFNDGKYEPASNPFILDKQGSVIYLKPSLQKKQTVGLLRKFPSLPVNDSNMMSMRGGRFQVANKIDFSDSVNIFYIDFVPKKIEDIDLKPGRKYRYMRYVTPLGQKANVAEIEIYGRNEIKGGIKKMTGTPIGQPKLAPETGVIYENVFDNNLETYFTTEKTDTSWVGIDFQKPVYISKVRYCPRSDTNFILEGDTYELCYWLDGKWVSMGKKKATGQEITFPDVPMGAVYILHNLSRGNEERIFTLDQNKQIWW